MKTIKLLALLAVLAVAGLANAQTLTRSLVLKPAGETNTLTFGSSTPIGTSFSINLPGGGNAAGGPIVRTSTAVGTKDWSFGQINLAANTAVTGDVTGTLGVTNGGTGLNNAPINSILYASAANVYSSLSTGIAGQVLGSVAGVPTWGTTLGGGGATTNISSTGAGNTTNINAAPATGGTTNIGNNTSLTNLNGTVVFQNAPSIPLLENYIWVGNASNVQAPVAPTANSILITDNVAGGTPQWGTTLPTGLTLPGATITTPTITGGTISGTPISGSTGSFTTLSSTGTSTIGTGAGLTNSFGTGAGTNNTIGDATGAGLTTIAGDVTFSAPAGDVVFTNMPSLPLTTNNMYVGVAGKAAELSTVASRVLTSSAGGVPTWTAVLPIANGGTNSSTVGAAGTVSYSTGAALVSTTQGTTGQLLQSNGAGAPTWTNVGNLLASASFTLTAAAADVTAGFLTVDVTSVPTLISGYGYDASSRIIVTIESASGPGQVVSVTNRTASDFRIYTGAIAAGDKVNVLIIDTTP